MSMDLFEKCYQPGRVDEIREKNIYPYFHALESRQDTEVIMEGKRRIMLGSNNYLGLTTCPEVIEAGVKAYRELGSGCSGSRFLNGTLQLHLELEDEVDIYMGTFSKSLASLGGYMAASDRVADYVRHNSRPFIFSASIPPANCAAALAALRYLERHPEIVDTLQGNALYMREQLNKRDIKMRPSNGERIPIVPIYTYEEIPTLTIAKDLYDHGVYVNSSLPPAAAPHECLLRTSLMATHTHALIDEAVDIVADVLGGMTCERRLRHHRRHVRHRPCHGPVHERSGLYRF